MINLHNFTAGAARNHAPQVFSDADIRRVAPSVFAEAPHGSRSDKYAYIPTSRVVEAMRQQGYVVTSAKQSKCRLADRSEFTKHQLVFQTAESKPLAVGDSVASISLVNSHDGSSAYKLLAGILRLACSNGLLVSESEFDSISVPHIGDVRDRVIEGSFRVISESAAAGERAAAWRSLELAPAERQAFARAALAVRFEDQDVAPVTVDQALTVRRSDDRGTDLWSTFNVLQENLVRGGQRYRGANGRRMSTRAVTGIDGSNTLNRSLWRLAAEMAALKAVN